MPENIALAFSLIIAVIGMFRYKKLTMPIKLLVFYSLFTVLDNLSDRLLIAVFNNNVPLLHVEAIANYIFFSTIYYHLFKNPYIKKLILVSAVPIGLFFLLNATFIQPFDSVFPSNELLINEILFAALSVLMFKQMLLYPVQVNITKQGVFWFNTAVLFFSATMFLNFTLINYYVKHNIHPPILIYFWHFIDIMLNVLVGVAILNDKREYSVTSAE